LDVCFTDPTVAASGVSENDECEVEQVPTGVAAAGAVVVALGQHQAATVTALGVVFLAFVITSEVRTNRLCTLIRAFRCRHRRRGPK
jgi:hypothetical protein